MPNTLPPSLTGKSLLDDKKERIAAKAEEKKEILDPIQARLDRQLVAANARAAQGWESVRQAQVDNAALIQAREDAFDADRSTPVEKYLRDAGIKASQMLTGVVGGGVSLANDLVSKGTSEALNAVVPGAEGLSDVLEMGNPMRAYGAAPATEIETPELRVPSAAPKVSAATRAVIDGMESWTSKQGQASARVSAGERAKDVARIDAEYEAALKKGNGKLSAQLAREAKNAGSAFVHAVDDPNNLVNNLASAAPTVAIAAMTGGGALGVMGVTGAMEGAGAYQQVADQIAATSYEDLKSQFPDVTRMIEEGASEEAIRAHLVTEVGLPAAATTGIAAALISKISLPFAKDPLGMARKAAAKEVATGIGRPLSGSIPGLVKGELLETGQEAKRLLLQDMLSEATEEAGQGLAAQVAVNQANRDAGNTSVELLDGTGAVIGEGAAVGGLMPAALRAPGYALRGTALAGSAVAPALKVAGSVVSSGAGAAVQAAGKLAEGRADKVRAGIDADTQGQQAAATEQASSDLRSALQNTGHTLDLGRAGDIAPEELDQLAVLSKIQQDWDDPTKVENRPVMATYAAHAEAGLNKLLRNVTGELRQENLPEERRADLVKIQQTATVLRGSPALAAARAKPDELLAGIDIPTITTMMKDESYEQMTPETRQAADTVRALINSGRTAGMSSETIENARLLYSEDLSEDEDHLFDVSSKVAKIQEAYQEEVAQRKTIKSVATEMRTGMFVLGEGEKARKLSSIREQMDAVMELSAAGMYREAKGVLDHMSWWVNHQGKRAIDFNEKATAQLQAFHKDGTWESQELIGDRLDSTGQKIARGEKQVTKLEFKGGQEFGRAIREDAQALADTYNSLRELLPEDLRPAAVNATFDRTWEGLLAGAPVQGGNTKSKPAAEQAPASNEAAREAASQPTESAAPQAPAKTEGQAPVADEQAAEGETASSEAETKKEVPLIRVLPFNLKKKARKTRAKKPRKPKSLLTVLRTVGGLSREDFKQYGNQFTDAMAQKGSFRLFNKNGMTLAELREYMQQEGYLPRDPEDGRPVVDDNDALDLVASALAGNEVYSEDQYDALTEYLDAKRQDDEAYQAEQQAKQEEDAPAETQAERESRLIAKAQALLGETTEAGPAVNFNDPTPASEQELDDALAMDPEAYIYAVSGGVVTPPTAAKVIREELAAVTVPEDAETIAEVGVIEIKANGDYLYAVDPTQNNLVVGQLIHKQGTSLVVHPDSNYRNKGIGEAMMTELLRRKPMAGSNGLSPAARKLRLKVMGNLRAERRAQLTASRGMLDRFPGLKTFRGLKNKLLSAFKTNERSKSIFLRLENPVEEVREALAQGPEAVRALFADKLDYTGAIDDAAIQSLRYLFGAHVDRMRNALNTALQGRMDSELTAALLDNSTTPRGFVRSENLWVSTDHMGLHAVVTMRDADGKQVFRYQPKVLDAMILGGTRWAMNNLGAPGNFDEERVAKMFPARLIPQALRPYLRGWRNQQSVVSSIAGEITQLLAISGLSDVSVTTTDGLPKALAADVLNAFMRMPNLLGAERQAELGEVPAMLERAEVDLKNAYAGRNPLNASRMAELTEELIKKFGPKMVFVRFPETLADNGMSTLRALGGMLGSNTVIFDALLSAKTSPRALVGRAARAVRGTVRTTGGRIGKGQELLLKRLNNIGHAVNSPLADAVFKGFSDEVRARLFGKPIYDESTTNAGHLETLKGKAQSARRTEYETRLLLERMQAHATATGKTLEEVLAYWEYEIQSNGRAHQQGFGGQANKWARELFVPSMPPIDFNDANQVDEYWMALAQAFGIKTTNKALSLVIAEAQEMVSGSGSLAELMEAFRNFDPANPPEDGGEALLSLFEAAKFGHPERAFNALLTHARFEKADRGQPFKHSLVYEIDGKTDGPINALMQFGLAFLDARLLRQLRQGGLFAGTTDEQSLNDAGTGLGDLYLNGVEGWGDSLRKRMAGMQPLERSLVQANLVALSKVKRAEATSVDLGDGEGPVDQYEAKRDLFKNPLTQKVYGAADGTMMIRAAKEIMAHYHQVVNQALQENRLLSANEIAEIEMVAGFLIETDQDGEITNVIKTGIPPLATREDMLAFELGPLQESALRSVMEAGTGQTLAEMINDEMQSVEPTMRALYAATAFQAWASHHMYEKLYAARRQELIAAGELNMQEALSRDEEQKLREQVAHLSPRFHTSQTEGGDGIIINEKAQGGTLPILHKSSSGRSTVRTQSLLGGFSADINRTTFDPDAGVRIAAQLNIAAGDASMMGGIFGEMVRHWLNVFDGLEAPPGQLRAASEAANKAVWNNWQYDLLGSVIEQFNKFEMDFSKLSKEEVYSLAQALRINKVKEFAKGNLQTRQTMLEDMLKQQRTTLAFLHQRTLLVKRVLGELHIAVDHMSGRQQPHTQDGVVLADQDAVIAYIERRIAELGGTDGVVSAEGVADSLANIELSNGTPAAPAADKGAVVKTPEPGKDELAASLQEMSGKELRETVLNKHVFKNKVAGFVYTRIRGLIPDDLKIVSGDAADVLARALRDHPNAGIKSVKQGLYFKGTVYLPTTRKADGTAETGLQYETNVVHELIHAVTYAALDDFYTNGGKRLTWAQKEAIRNLEKLAAHAIKMKVPTDTEAGRVFAKVQGILAGFQATNDNFKMVAELLSYTLTNRHVQTALKHQKGPEGIRAVAGYVLGAIKKFFGLPTNPAVDDFMVQMIGQLERLNTRPITDGNPLQQATPLHNAIDDAEAAMRAPEHDAHLDQLATGIDTLLELLPDDGIYFSPAGYDNHNRYSRGMAVSGGVHAAERFVAAQFYLSGKERDLFARIHAVMTAVQELDAHALIELQRMHTQVMATLEPKHLLEEGETLDDPDTRNVTIPARMAALRDPGQQDLYGRSELLANFVALASVSAPLRAHLASQRMAADKVDRGSMDGFLRTGTQKIFNLLGARALRNNGKTLEAVLDHMTQRMIQAEQKSKSSGQHGLRVMAKAEERVKNALHAGSPLLARGEAQVRDWAAGTSNGFLKGVGNAAALGLHLGKSFLDKDLDGDAMSVALNQVLNEAKMPQFFKDIGQEMLGTHSDNAEIHRLLNSAKTRISQIRQRLREHVPALLQKLFKEALSKQQWKILHRSIGMTDLQTLLGDFSVEQLAELLRDPGKLDAAIETVRAKLPGALAQALAPRAEALGRYMVTKDNSDGDILLNRNAHAMLVTTRRMFGGEVANVTAAEKHLDQLISLYAVKHLSPSELTKTAEILEKDAAGSKQLLNVMRSIVELEHKRLNEQTDEKARDLRMNMWKGYIPTTSDPRKDLVLAGPQQGAELLKRGYVMVSSYQSDRADPTYGMAYYSTNLAGGLATYNQGAMQTVEHSLMGIDSLTGMTLDPAAQTMIKHSDDVWAITDQKWKAAKSRGSFRGQGQQLLPIFNATGSVVAYERPMDAKLLKEHTRSEGHLAQAVGMWLGRQAEESLADDLNESVIDALSARWDLEKTTRESEYIQINSPRASAVDRATWDALPRATQARLEAKFPDGKVMIRSDLKNNALGYRAASVADIFTGTSNLAPETRKALEDIAFALAGRRAYPLLVTGERAWQGLIGTAKDVIVVRSGVVAVANLLANQVQLMQMTGWNPARLLRVQMGKAKELEQYMRNQSRLTEIVVKLASGVGTAESNQLHLEKRSLEDANKRLSIEPLLRAGMLPTIAEGLTEQDQFSLLGDGMRWIEERAEKLPKGVLTAAKYAVVSKDTALYQGLNRMVQFGDFMAKAALYEALVEEAKSKPDPNSAEEWQILDEVNQAFVNYNLLPGRGRDYLEGMGVTWFWNYKLRIQKIAIQQIRKNPLRFLAAGVGADWFDLDSLMTSTAPMINWQYSVGPDQLWRSHETLLWRNLMQ